MHMPFTMRRSNGVHAHCLQASLHCKEKDFPTEMKAVTLQAGAIQALLAPQLTNNTAPQEVRTP